MLITIWSKRVKYKAWCHSVPSCAKLYGSGITVKTPLYAHTLNRDTLLLSRLFLVTAKAQPDNRQFFLSRLTVSYKVFLINTDNLTKSQHKNFLKLMAILSSYMYTISLVERKLLNFVLSYFSVLLG